MVQVSFYTLKHYFINREKIGFKNVREKCEVDRKKLYVVKKINI